MGASRRHVCKHGASPLQSRAMLRLVGFFAATWVLFQVFVRVPVIGSLFGAIPILGFFATAAILRWGIVRWGEAAIHWRRQQALMRELGAVETPYNQGKLGMLLLQQGRFAKAEPYLRAAVEAEPDSADWQYRLGSALLGTKQHDAAVDALSRAVAIDEEHAYGGAMMRLAEAQLAAGRPQESLDTLDRLDRNHGEGPESAYRRGLALKALGRRDEAKRVLSGVGRIASEAVGYQKKDASLWTLRATFARVF